MYSLLETSNYTPTFLLSMFIFLGHFLGSLSFWKLRLQTRHLHVEIHSAADPDGPSLPWSFGEGVIGWKDVDWWWRWDGHLFFRVFVCHVYDRKMHFKRNDEIS